MTTIYCALAYDRLGIPGPPFVPLVAPGWIGCFAGANTLELWLKKGRVSNQNSPRSYGASLSGVAWSRFCVIMFSPVAGAWSRNSVVSV